MDKVGLPPVTEDLIANIELAFGFKLYQWQKDYILGKINYRVGGRRNGNTFAYCLRLLLWDGTPIDIRELHLMADEVHGKPYKKWFANYCKEIDDTLKKAGIKTRLV